MNLVRKFFLALTVLTGCGLIVSSCRQQPAPEAKTKAAASAPRQAASKPPSPASAKSKSPAPKPQAPSRVVFNGSLPGTWPKDIPLAPDAQVVNGYYTSDLKTFYAVLDAGANGDKVNSYYQSLFAKGGYQQESQFSGGRSSGATYRKSERRVTVMLTTKAAKPGGKPASEVDITITSG